MTKALEGIKVVEIGAAVAMPIAGMLMGSWGADVVHVEAPGERRHAAVLEPSPRGVDAVQRDQLPLGARGPEQEEHLHQPGEPRRAGDHPQALRGGRRVSEQPAPLRDAEVQPDLRSHIGAESQDHLREPHRLRPEGAGEELGRLRLGGLLGPERRHGDDARSGDGAEHLPGRATATASPR